MEWFRPERYLDAIVKAWTPYIQPEPDTPLAEPLRQPTSWSDWASPLFGNNGGGPAGTPAVADDEITPISSVMTGPWSRFAESLTSPWLGGNPHDDLLDRPTYTDYRSGGKLEDFIGSLPLPDIRKQRQGSNPASGTTPGLPENNYAGGDAAQGSVMDSVLRWKSIAEKAAAQYGVPVEAIYSLMNIESGGDPRATGVLVTSGSMKGQRARGLMQVMEGHFQPGEDWYDPETNIRVALERVLKPAYDKYKSWESAAAAYLGAVDPRTGRPTSAADDNGTTGHEYVRRFANNYASYRQRLGAAVATAPQQAAGQFAMGQLTPDQFNSGLDGSAAVAACGPAAAVAFARYHGRNPTLAEAVAIAKNVGWRPGSSGGMAGPASQVRLLKEMGIEASMERLDRTRLLQQVQSGKPVILSSPAHYWVIEGYDPASGKFNFGNSAKAIRRSGGKTWFTLEELGGLIGGGTPDTAIYMA